MWMEEGDKLAAQYGIEPRVLVYLDKVSKAAGARMKRKSTAGRTTTCVQPGFVMRPSSEVMVTAFLAV